ncbi:hypothetical protein CEXT_372031 [Caerostris extrusa]|uniref:Uncharacterized protein n=1 Tax=Caerostris extrusa TaxID=172846 RepID=A0AAV4PJT4_CAEEX|nr:hypothetical protein CEXT_372031 [Caerostris extrusa]
MKTISEIRKHQWMWNCSTIPVLVPKLPILKPNPTDRSASQETTTLFKKEKLKDLMNAESSTNPMLSLNCSCRETQPTCPKCFCSCPKENKPFNKSNEEVATATKHQHFPDYQRKGGKKITESLENIPVYIFSFSTSLDSFIGRIIKEFWVASIRFYLACTISRGNRIFQAVLRDGLNLDLGIK